MGNKKPMTCAEERQKYIVDNRIVYKFDNLHEVAKNYLNSRLNAYDKTFNDNMPIEDKLMKLSMNEFENWLEQLHFYEEHEILSKEGIYYCPTCNENVLIRNTFISNGTVYCKKCNTALSHDDIDYTTGVNHTTHEVYPTPLIDIPMEENCKNDTMKTLPQHYCFRITKYTLTDVIEELTNSGAKEICVTKEDGEFVVSYKPSWRDVCLK